VSIIGASQKRNQKRWDFARKFCPKPAKTAERSLLNTSVRVKSAFSDVVSRFQAICNGL